MLVLQQMSESTGAQTFDQIVKWAYSTLPQKIRELPDFPGIQVVDEPPPDVLRERREKGNWPAGREILGLYSGIRRTEEQLFRQKFAPDLIFVFRGPILRCSRGDLRAEVKQVVWHEVAHWLGHDEEGVRALGLSEDQPKSEVPMSVSQLDGDEETGQEVQEATERPRCIKCYSADVTCHQFKKPLSYAGANIFDATATVHARSCRCNSCGHEWDDADTY